VEIHENRASRSRKFPQLENSALLIAGVDLPGSCGCCCKRLLPLGCKHFLEAPDGIAVVIGDGDAASIGDEGSAKLLPVAPPGHDLPIVLFKRGHINRLVRFAARGSAPRCQPEPRPPIYLAKFIGSVRLATGLAALVKGSIIGIHGLAPIA
jgi:hypothetical protein